MKRFFIHFLAWWLFVLAVINTGACIFRYTTNGIHGVPGVGTVYG